MTGVVGALTAAGVVLAIVLLLAVRPPARRLARAVVTTRADLSVRLDRLRALRAVAPAGTGRHRRIDGAP